MIKDDGEFFMQIDDYLKYTAASIVNYNVDNMSRATFLVLDDDNTETRQSSTCNGECSYHRFTITSRETQTVYLKVATWPGRGLPNSCRE